MLSDRDLLENDLFIGPFVQCPLWIFKIPEAQQSDEFMQSGEGIPVIETSV